MPKLEIADAFILQVEQFEYHYGPGSDYPEVKKLQ